MSIEIGNVIEDMKDIRRSKCGPATIAAEADCFTVTDGENGSVHAAQAGGDTSVA